MVKKNKNNKKSSTSVKKPSSFIPVQEFVDAFTTSFEEILRHLLDEFTKHPNFLTYTEKVVRPLIPGGDLVKPTVLSHTYNFGPVTSSVYYGIVSAARLKARQQLDSLSSRYQNSLSSLAEKNKQAQSSNKGKQKDQSNSHVSQETCANIVIDEPMHLDETDDPKSTVSQPNQEGDLAYHHSDSSSSKSIGTSLPNTITQSETQKKKDKITRLTLNNNVVHDAQKGQVRTIMIYDIPTAWSHDEILNKLSSWGRVLEISFKPQHKYQSVWTKMILKPKDDTDFVMRIWNKKLVDKFVRWYPGHWKLKDRKERERFQAKILIPNQATDAQWNNYLKGQSFDVYMQKTLKVKSFSSIIDRGNKFVITYFESQNDLHNFMEAEHIWKPTISSSPGKRQSNKSKKDKKQNSKSSKGKKAGTVSTSSTKSRDKSKHKKVNDDTRSLLKLILNLLQ